MTDEEKEALEILNKTEWDVFMITIKNLIEKQQKEIEDLKQKNEYLPAWVGKKYVSKDKIKAKIEELKETADEDNKDDFIRIEVLQSLLEKN